jgi:hypothetical protein
MAHFAQLDENKIVLQVVVLDNDKVNDLSFPDSEPLGIAALKEIFGAETNWVQTRYNHNFRKEYACVGGQYLPQGDIFVGPQPYPSWILNPASGWESPAPMPEVPNLHIAVWDEENQEWDIVLDGNTI